MLFAADPMSGPESGGTIVKLFGANLPNSLDLQCKFGNFTVSGKFISEKEIECITPVLALDRYEIGLSSNKQDFVMLVDKFYAQPII